MINLDRNNRAGDPFYEDENLDLYKGQDVVYFSQISPKPSEDDFLEEEDEW